MSILDRVEKCLRPINTWPTYIIRFLSVDKPMPNIVKKLTAFMIGNGVNVEMAADLYLLCNVEWHPRIKDECIKFICMNIIMSQTINIYGLTVNLWIKMKRYYLQLHPQNFVLITGYGPFIKDRLIYVRHDVKCE
jgi:hypothetical protein